MYVKINSEIKKIIQKCIEKAGSERQLYKILKIPKSLYNYRIRSKTIPLPILKKLLQFLNIEEDKIITKSMLLPHNWRQKIGGIRSFQERLRKGTYKDNLEKMRKAASIYQKKIHRYQKKFNTEQYYNEQYRRFKKIAEYKFTTERGEKVRNILEKNVADWLFQNKIDYKYESFVKGKNRIYFPDFLLNNQTIIECTMWRGFDNSKKLSRKIKDLENKNFRIIVFITPSVRKFYKQIDRYVIDDLKMLNNQINSMPQ